MRDMIIRLFPFILVCFFLSSCEIEDNVVVSEEDTDDATAYGISDFRVLERRQINGKIDAQFHYNGDVLDSANIGDWNYIYSYTGDTVHYRKLDFDTRELIGKGFLIYDQGLLIQKSDSVVSDNDDESSLYEQVQYTYANGKLAKVDVKLCNRLGSDGTRECSNSSESYMYDSNKLVEILSYRDGAFVYSTEVVVFSRDSFKLVTNSNDFVIGRSFECSCAKLDIVYDDGEQLNIDLKCENGVVTELKARADSLEGFTYKYEEGQGISNSILFGPKRLANPVVLDPIAD